MLRKLPVALLMCFIPKSVVLADSASLSVKNDLLSVYQEAASNNADIANSRSGYAAQREIVPQARAGLLPNLSAGASNMQTRTSIDQPSYTANRSGNVYQATLSQPIFRPERWFQLQAAKQIDQQAATQLAAAEQNLILQSAIDYFAVLRAQDALATSKAEEQAFKSQYESSNARFNVGLIDRTDTLQAKASYDTARANRIVAQRQVEDAFQALTTLTDRTYNSVQGIKHTLPILPPMPNDAKAWVDVASQQNLNLQASNFGVTAAEQTLRQRKSGHAPTVDAVAQIQRGDNDSFQLTNPNYTGVPYSGPVEERTIGIQVNIPIYSGGLINSQVREATQRLSQSEQQQESLRRQVVESTRDLHRAVNTDVEQFTARQQAIISNESSVKATQIGYQVGTRNIVDVLDAQRQLYDSVRNYNNTRYDYIIDNLRLKQVTGTLSPEDLFALGEYLKPDYNPDLDFLPPGVNREPSVIK